MSWQRTNWERSQREAASISVPRSRAAYPLVRELPAEQGTSLISKLYDAVKSLDPHGRRLRISQTFGTAPSVTIVSGTEMKSLRLGSIPIDEAAYIDELAQRTGTSQHVLDSVTYTCGFFGNQKANRVAVGLAVRGVVGRALYEERLAACELTRPGSTAEMAPRYPFVRLGSVLTLGLDQTQLKRAVNAGNEDVGALQLQPVRFGRSEDRLGA